MTIIINLMLLACGIAVLVVSADWLIHGAVKLSSLFKISPLFVGIILIAFGTSAPEAGIGIIAALRNEKTVALGNVIGSNIANIGLIVGLCALILPLSVKRSVLKKEVPIMLGVSFLLFVLAQDLVLSRFDGLILIVIFILFCLFSYQQGKKSYDTKEIENFTLNRVMARLQKTSPVVGITLLALCGVMLGADLMVRGGVSLARSFGVSPWLIAVTVFAVGTSLPELVASLTASLKKVPSISVGNIIGSNIFNILFVLGVVALIRPIPVAPGALGFEFPAMLIFSAALFVVMRSAYTITRREGLFLFLGYACFLTFLILKQR